jgi:putative ABC transport system permease protein
MFKIFKLALKNIFNKPLSLALSLVLFALGSGLITALLLLNRQLEDQFTRNLADVELVIGAKGSPLQLILCNMYHIDNPTGNISLAETKPFLNPRHPLISKAIPLSLGDNYKSFRITGTTPGFLTMYNASFEQGRVWENDYEVVIGKSVADQTGLKIGDEFDSSHGFMEDDDLIHEQHIKFKVVGILNPAGSVIDQLILCNSKTVWLVHEHEEVEEVDSTVADSNEVHDHHHHSEEPISTNPVQYTEKELLDLHANAVQELISNEEKDITSILVQFRGRNYQTLNMQRSINENTNLQAATPAIEINRLFVLMGVGIEALRALAIIIMIVSGLSIFISMLNALKERKYELALMRAMGASRWQLLTLIVAEGAFIAMVGYFIGALLGHASVALISGYMQDSYRYALDGWVFLPEEGILFIACIVLGKLAALLPAIQAYRTDIANTLTQRG